MAAVTAPVGRREQKRLQTRRDLEEAAWRLFLEKGFADTTIDDITDAVPVSQRTFFRHFPSKEAVLFADHPEQIRRFREFLAQVPRDRSVLAAVHAAVQELAGDLSADRDRHLLRFQLAESAPTVRAYGMEVVEQAWLDAIAHAAAERLGVVVDRDLRPRLIAGAAISAITAAMRMWSANGGEGDPAELADEAFRLLPTLFTE